jgi:hypothetical protein
MDYHRSAERETGEERRGEEKRSRGGRRRQGFQHMMGSWMIIKGG